MKVKRNDSIREKVPFTGEVASMTLDMYYKTHVQEHGTPKLERKPSPYLRDFHRTHYFGPGYLKRKPPAFLEQTRLMDKFQRNIREVKNVIDFKVAMDTQQRLLKQLKIDITQQEPVAVDKDAEIEHQEHQLQPLNSGDQIL